MNTVVVTSTSGDTEKYIIDNNLNGFKTLEIGHMIHLTKDNVSDSELLDILNKLIGSGEVVVSKDDKTTYRIEVYDDYRE